MTNKITFSDLVAHISSEAGVPKKFANDYLRELSTVIEEGLLRDGTVSINGFGSFRLQWAAPRTGRNPRTGEPMQIAGRNKIVFRPHKRLREYINRRYKNLSVEVLHSADKSAAARLAPDTVRASAAEAIGAAHTIAEKVTVPPLMRGGNQQPARPAVTQPANPQETAAKLFTKENRDRSDLGVLPDEAAKGISKKVWMGVGAGVLVLLAAGVFILMQNNAPPDSVASAPPPADNAAVSSTGGNGGAGAPQTGQPAVWVAEPATAAAVTVPNRSAPVAPEILKPAAVLVSAEESSSAGGEQVASTVAAVAAVESAAPPVAAEPAAPSAVAPANTGTPGGVHHVQRGDSLWGISKSSYNDPYLWPNIYRVNDESIANPNVLRNGIDITVPPLEGTSDNLTQQDRKDVAAGYLSAYFAYKRLGKIKAAYYLWVAELRDPDVVRANADRIDPADMEFIRTIRK